MNRTILGLMASAAIALPAAAQQTMPQGPRTEQTQPPQGAPAQGEISPTQLSRDQIMELQQALKDKGFNAGPVDGAWGPSTAGALRDFQAKEGIMGSRLNARTLTALGLDASGFGAMQPDPRVAPGAPPSRSPDSQPGATPDMQPDRGTGTPDRNIPGAAPQQRNPGTGPGGPTR